MKTYRVVYEQRCRYVYEVDAESPEDARKWVGDRLAAGEDPISPGVARITCVDHALLDEKASRPVKLNRGRQIIGCG